MKTHPWPPVFKKSMRGPWHYEYRVSGPNAPVVVTTISLFEAQRAQISATVEHPEWVPLTIERRVVGEWEDGAA